MNLPIELQDTYACPFRWGDWTARTAEHALLAARSRGDDRADAERWATWVLDAPTVQAARVRARAMPWRSDWAAIEAEVRASILFAKFSVPMLRAVLLAAEQLDPVLQHVRLNLDAPPPTLWIPLLPAPHLPPPPPAVAEPAAEVLADEHAQHTVLQERARLQAHMQTGSTCRACGQRVQVYRRTLQSGLVRDLIRIYRVWAERGGPERLQKSLPTWLAVDQVPGVRGGEYAKARFWRLIEQRPRGESTRVATGQIRTSGEWSFTPLGVEFLRGLAPVRKAVWVYNNELAPGPWEREDDKSELDIRQALGARFHYETLMSGR